MHLTPIPIEETARLIKLLDEAIENEQHFYEKLICFTDIGMVILDRVSTQFLFANPGACKIYNRSLTDLQSHTLTDLTDVEYIKNIENGLELLEASEIKSYKTAKVYIIPPDNIKKIAFMELVEIATTEKSPYILGFIIEKQQLEAWLSITQKITSAISE